MVYLPRSKRVCFAVVGLQKDKQDKIEAAIELKKTIFEILQKQTDEQLDYSLLVDSQFEVDVEYCNSLGHMERVISGKLDLWRGTGVSFTLVSGGEDLDGVDALKHAPVLFYPSNPPSLRFPSSSPWDYHVLSIVLTKHLPEMDNWFRAILLPQSRITKVPICNLGAVPDPEARRGFALDVLFTRELREKKCLIWNRQKISDLRLEQSDRAAQLVSNKTSKDVVSISNPGVYRSFCVNLKIGHANLLTAALSQSKLLLDLQGGSDKRTGFVSTLAASEAPSAGDRHLQALTALVTKLYQKGLTLGEKVKF